MRFALTSSAFGRTLNYIFDLEQFMENIHLVFDTPKVNSNIIALFCNRFHKSTFQHLASIPEVPVRVFHAVVDPVGV